LKCENGGIINAMLPAIDSILAVRDSVGAVIKPVYFVTRQWYTDSGLTMAATQPEGFAKDSVVQLLPSPGMKNFNQDVRLREGGAIKAGDIILKDISANKFQEADLDGTTPNKGVSKFYLIGVKLYQVINVTRKYVTFDVQVRELTNQTRY
jgi:hypothetical protein